MSFQMQHIFRLAVLGTLSFGFMTNVGYGEPSLRVAYVDLNHALQTSTEGRSAKSKLETEFQETKASLTKKQENFQKDYVKFQKQSTVLKPEVKRQREADLQQRMMEIQRSAQESQIQAQQKEMKITQPIIERLRGIIASLAKEKHYQLVIEKNTGTILYAEGAGPDLTTLVVEKSNKTFKPTSAH